MIIKHLTSQQSNSIEMKNRIYKAAAELLKNYDTSYLTIRHICKEAEVSTGTFYHHFENKDDLLSYFFIYGIKDYLNQNEVEATEDIVQNIINMYDVYFSFCLANGIEFLSNYYSTKNKGIYIRGKHTQEQLDKMPVIQKCIGFIDIAKKEGFLKEEVSSYEIMEDIAVIVKGIIFEWCISEGTFDLKREGFKLIKYHFHSLLTEKYFNTFKY